MNVKILLQVIGLTALLASIETACADERLYGQLEDLRASQSELQRNLSGHRNRKAQIESLIVQAEKQEKAFTAGRETVLFSRSHAPARECSQ